LLIIILLLSGSPILVSSPYMLNIIIAVVIYAYIGVSWNITGGFAGQLLFGHISFFGLGAYTTLVLLNVYGISPWIGIPLAAIPATLFGLFVAFVSLRYGLRVDYFALFTIAMMVLLRIIFGRWEFVGAAMGKWIEFRGESFINMAFVSKLPYLYISLFLLLVAVVISYIIYRSKLGTYLIAIREDEDSASALGVNIAAYKTYALLITAALHGIGGGFYAVFTTFIQPILIFGLQLNVELLVAPVIGGRGTLIGPVVGAIVNKPIAELTRGWFAGGQSGTTLIIYGAFLVIFILFIPQGIEGYLRKIYLKLLNRFGKEKE
jgi:branched-chain amino acid transport system permease protein